MRHPIITAGVTSVVSLFNHSLGIYEVHDSDGCYHVGFPLGVSISFSGTGAGARGSSRSAR